jgi:(p)ppGpp synthase/HD superfamily hydrolase
MAVMKAADQKRLLDALAFALEAHGDQTRKGTEIPYASHLLQVGGLVQEHGGSIEQVMAAFLHDAIEDCAHVDYEVLMDRFGKNVADIVRDCTDTQPDETPENKRAWKDRKRAYLEHLEEAPDASMLVSVCDKVHNLAAIVADVRNAGPQYLEKFNAEPREQIWYFQSIHDSARNRIPQRLALEMTRLLAELRTLLSSGSAASASHRIQD